MNEPPAPSADDGAAVTPLTEPAGGLPPVTTRPDELEKVADAFARGTGPVAADAERASGYRYGQATYLVQLKRAGAGIALVDPVALPDLSIVSDAVGDAEYVLHAASQDLPGLNEHGIVPARVFDTELAARLLGFERVGLAAVVAETLGLGLAKEHSAVDWSTRPLPEDWLRYAALDVEVLVEVRDDLAARLEAAGKAEWAAQEFEAVRTAPPPPPRVDPWRRTSGMHVLRSPRQVAVVRALWEARDATARARDISPGRVLPDRAIVAAARAMPRTAGQLVALPEFAGKGIRRRAGYWQRAIDGARELPENRLPSVRGPRTDGPPAPRLWGDRDPVAARRLKSARELVATLSERHAVPVENLLQPDALRRLCWKPPEPADADAIAEFLRERRAREWQVSLLAAPLAETLAGIR
ncbi:ribonuclease D [Myceligenerans pegani]|uniref:Ribonuclease D n=1 Tax=Myceligenerans pegani TaxID=2776917 RepID=A0ABR9MZI1_9MICO|nr:ribonuclease D [Myceligenerans sp. TRM 65318]MBE1876815.1 ribonuclease D [Myceligenerans sp. TRM 65318]MBE3019086.1 ribonuclease D [Myceligenerans sp. TRM 65318]